MPDNTSRVTVISPGAIDSNGSSGDWLNEIHLNDNGKDKFAKFWAQFL